MDTLLNDIRFALRSVGKSKMFTAVALVSLARLRRRDVLSRGMLAIVSLAATWVPAGRAARVSALEALRAE